jgi:hypothetical protein
MTHEHLHLLKYIKVKWIITKVVEIKEFWVIKPFTKGNRKDVSLSVDSNDSLFAIFFQVI